MLVNDFSLWQQRIGKLLDVGYLLNITKLLNLLDLFVALYLLTYFVDQLILVFGEQYLTFYVDLLVVKFKLLLRDLRLVCVLVFSYRASYWHVHLLAVPDLFQDLVIFVGSFDVIVNHWLVLISNLNLLMIILLRSILL